MPTHTHTHTHHIFPITEAGWRQLEVLGVRDRKRWVLSYDLANGAIPHHTSVWLQQHSSPIPYNINSGKQKQEARSLSHCELLEKKELNRSHYSMGMDTTEVWACRTEKGRLFKMAGPVKEKARSPWNFLRLFTIRKMRLSAKERRVCEGMNSSRRPDK